MNSEVAYLEERKTEVKHLRACGAPEKSVRFIERYGLRAVRNREPHRHFAEFLKGEKLVALLQGKVGSGKTTLAILAFLSATKPAPQWDEAEMRCREVTKLDASQCYFFSASKMARLNQGWSEDRPTLDRLERATYLVLDDLAMEPEGDSKMQDKLEALLCERDAWCRRTIITTNADPKELRRRYGERVASRFAQEATIISCGDMDFRREPEA